MKSLNTLIRLQKKEIDELKRQKTLFEEKREECYQALSRLADQLQFEMKTAQQMPDMAQFFGDFAASIKTGQEQINGLIRRTDKEIETLAQRIQERFSEMKKYEITLENYKKREKEKIAKRDAQTMDDIAINNYIRNHDA